MKLKYILSAIVLSATLLANAHTFTDRGLVYSTLPDWGCELIGVADIHTTTLVDIPPLAVENEGTENQKIYDIRKIAKEAFRANNVIERVYANGNIFFEEVGDFAFAECYSLREAHLSYVNKFGMGVFQECHSLTFASYSTNAKHEISRFMFSGCSSLKAIQLYNSVTGIAQCAFQDCSSLTWINIPESVTHIDNYAFNNCTSLRGVRFGMEGVDSELTELGEGVFNYCTNLYEVTLPKKLESIGDAAFYNCDMLHKITFGDNIKSIGDMAFDNTPNLTSITLPASLTEIGERAFDYSPKLKNVTLLGEVPPTLGWNAFSKNYQPFFYVPEGSLEQYKQADGWSEFDNIVDSEITLSVNMPEGLFVIGNADRQSHTISLKPNEGYKINTAMLGDTDITEHISDNGRYEVPRLNEHKVLNVTFEKKADGVDDSSLSTESVKVYTSNGTISLTGLADSETISVYNLDGQLILTTVSHSFKCNPGVYIVSTAKKTFKVRVN